MFYKIRIIYYLVIVLMLFFCYQIHADTTTEECYENEINPQWNCGSWTQTNTPVIVTAHDGDPCTLNVTYSYKECTETKQGCPPIIHYFVKVNYFDWDWEECTDLTEWLIPGYENEEWGEVDEAHLLVTWKEIQNKLANLRYEIFWNTLNEQEKFDYLCAGADPNCSINLNTCKNFSVHFTSSNCKAFCYWFEIGPSSIKLRVKPTDCASEGCCKTTFYYCTCLAMPEPYVYSEEINEGSYGYCTGNPPSCEKGQFVTDCIAICP
jgi:hypothetical protein